MVEILSPDQRACVRCGRREVWDEDSAAWQVPGDDVGDVFCVHDWDVTGQFTPVRES